MGFSFNEEVRDLFIKDGVSEGVHKVNRAAAREMAKKAFDYVNSVEASGGNKHAAELDIGDAMVEIYTRINLSEFVDYVESFSQAITDEKTALTMHELDKASESHRKNIAKIESDAKESAFNQAVLSWGAAIIGLIIFCMFLFSK
ncbi:hypothetical protein [Pantoea sp. A4]|uniref:hypothetical protein n=1 Tax=Pantoea sp. A4 TaxID=1225184 RepID=UPI0005605C73|nr:hypothetical protein [Pantoea sp. A4]